MMKTLKNLTLVFLFISLISCEADNEPQVAIGNVDIYLLATYNSESTYGEIKNENIILESKPLIPYSEIVSYDKNMHVFEISEDALDTIQNRMPIGSAFAITANNEIVYTGYFWSELFSSICGWNAITGTNELNNNEFKLEVSLGYPDYLVSIPDKRNSSKILNILRRDNKLIE